MKAKIFTGLRITIFHPEVLQGYYDDIAIYEQNASLIASGTAENLQKVADSVNYSYQKRSNSAVENLKIQISIFKFSFPLSSYQLLCAQKHN